jgi:hypothetical protein
VRVSARAMARHVPQRPYPAHDRDRPSVQARSARHPSSRPTLLRSSSSIPFTGEVVQSHERGRGYEVGQNQFLMVEDEELETARQEAKSRPYSAPPAGVGIYGSRMRGGANSPIVG